MRPCTRSRGWAQFGDFRAIGYTYGIQATYYGVIDNKGSQQAYNYGQNQGGEDVRVNAFKNWDNGFHGVLSVDYLSSFIFRQVFAQGFSEAIQSEVISTGFVYKNWDGYAFGVMADSYQNYQSDAPGDYIQIVHSPTLELSTVERQFSRTNAVYSYDFAAAGVSEMRSASRPHPSSDESTPLPTWRGPELFHGWTFRPQIGGRETFYTERVVPGASATVIGIPKQDPMNRTVGNASFELRPPTLSKIFDRKPFGYALKHTIEPYAVYRYQGGIGDFCADHPLRLSRHPRRHQ